MKKTPVNALMCGQTRLTAKDLGFCIPDNSSAAHAPSQAYFQYCYKRLVTNKRLFFSLFK